MQPIRNNILFKPLPSNNISEGGMIVPDSCKVINDKGIIVAVGNGTPNKPMRLREGMVVHRVKQWGTEVIIDGELHFLMDADAILSID